VAIALTGQRNPLFWSGGEREAKFDLYDLKGLVEEFFAQFGIRGATYCKREERTSLFLESATIQLGKLALGEMASCCRRWRSSMICATPSICWS